MDINSNFQIELLPNEEWRDVVGYEGLYQVSNMGRAYNVRKKCLCRHQVTPKGYIDISLSKNGKSTYQKLHRLIYIAFVGSIDLGKEIDHVNAIRHDNRLSNLRLVSHKENMNNPLTIKALSGKIGPLNPNYGRQASEETREKLRAFLLSDKNPRRGTPLSEEHRLNISKALKGKKVSEQTRLKIAKPILQFDIYGNFIREFSSAVEIEKELGIKRSNICHACRGRVKVLGGYKWKYKNDDTIRRI